MLERSNQAHAQEQEQDQEASQSRNDKEWTVTFEGRHNRYLYQFESRADSSPEE
ncbi:hypothetical protein BJ508DRAFT_414231 [Ascobolus immersus RN42]|uniref:Uncharacterized protein n=1 Tax=Ascobolus immersus RN42 TaxID=1160509 RepID=A0A3N4I9L4_ASCIM|nr:hypothetical protein BJ508DRAFT_414231 [Ascobolus immersus RN42]